MDETRTDATPEAASNEGNMTVHSNNVALPEVRTGHVDVEGDFAKEQDALNAEHEHRVSYDTVAVPEYHTGKCPPHDPDCEEREDVDVSGSRKRRHLFGDLARTLMNGSADK